MIPSTHPPFQIAAPSHTLLPIQKDIPQSPCNRYLRCSSTRAGITYWLSLAVSPLRHRHSLQPAARATHALNHLKRDKWLDRSNPSAWLSPPQSQANQSQSQKAHQSQKAKFGRKQIPVAALARQINMKSVRLWSRPFLPSLHQNCDQSCNPLPPVFSAPLL